MATQVQFRGGTTTEHASFNGAAREVTVDTTKQTLVVQDGTTNGGYPLMRENGTQSLTTTGDVSIDSDSSKLKIGDGENLQVYFDGSHSRIHNDTGHLLIETDAASAIEINKGVTANLAKFIPDGAVELYWAGSKKFHTTTNGPAVSTAGTDASRLYFETDGHTASRIGYVGTGKFSLDVYDGLVVRDVNDSYNTRFTIDSSGKFGIGTVAPPDAVNIVGTTRINQSATLDHLCNAGTMLEVRGDGIGSGVVDTDFFKGFKIALNDGTEYGGQAQFAVGRFEEGGNNARSSLMISLGHGAQSSSADADTDVLLLKSDGQVEIVDGNLKVANGHGIDFSASESSNTNPDSVLDDYEEGSWSPTFNGLGAYSSYAVWRYTKIGNLVQIGGRLVVTSTTNSSSDNVTFNLPFTSAANISNSLNDAVGVALTLNINTLGQTIIGHVASNTSTCYMQSSQDNGSWDSLNTDDVSVDDQMIFSMTYRAA